MLQTEADFGGSAGAFNADLFFSLVCWLWSAAFLQHYALWIAVYWELAGPIAPR